MKLSVALQFAFAALLTAPAMAGTRTLSFAPQDIALDGAIYEPDDQDINFPDNSAAGVIVTFRLPANYRKNSAITVRAQLSSIDVACDVVVTPLAVKRGRIGRVGSFHFAQNGGASVAISQVVPMPETSERHFTQTFKIRPANVGPILTQQAGDLIALKFVRDGAHPDDICTSSLQLHMVDVILQDQLITAPMPHAPRSATGH